MGSQLISMLETSFGTVRITGVIHRFCKKEKDDGNMDHCDDCQKIIAKKRAEEAARGNTKYCPYCKFDIFSSDTIVFSFESSITYHRRCYREILAGF